MPVKGLSARIAMRMKMKNKKKLTKILLAGLVLTMAAFAWLEPFGPSAQDLLKLKNTSMSSVPQAQPSGPRALSFWEIRQEIVNRPEGIQELVFVKNKAGLVDEVRIKFKSGQDGEASVPSQGAADELYRLAASKSVHIDGRSEQAPAAASGMFPLLLNVAMFILPIGFMVWMFRLSRRGPGGAQGSQAQHDKLQKSGAQRIRPEEVKTTFADVAGCEAAKRLLARTVAHLKNPERLARVGGTPRKGILLVGDPGNGKTLLAKAVAGEAKAVFFHISASQFVEMFVGLGAARVRDLFNEARKEKPAIIFIDEIDAVGRQRGAGVGNTNDERESTLNELLVQLDGFASNDAIQLIAATNRADVLDPALTRPGRFDLQISVENPDVAARLAILRVHTRNKPLGSDADLSLIAAGTPGMSGAQLAGVCNEAAHVAAERREMAMSTLIAEGKSEQEAEALVPASITMTDFDEGITRIQLGLASDHVMTQAQKLNTAVHELGHAFISWWRFVTGQGGHPIVKITIVSRGQALGYTLALPKGESWGHTKEELISRIMMAMGGRVAQEVILGVVDTGASNDFEQATNIARQMVTKFGMSDKVGPISVGEGGSAPFLGRTMATSNGISPELSNEIDSEWRLIISQCYAETRRLIEENKGCFKHMVEVLLTQETILGPQWEELFNSSSCAVKASPVRLVPDEPNVETHEQCKGCTSEDEAAGDAPVDPHHPGLLSGLMGFPGAIWSRARGGAKKSEPKK